MVIYTITYPPAPYPSLVQPDYGSIEPGSPRYPGLIPYPSFVQQAPDVRLARSINKYQTGLKCILTALQLTEASTTSPVSHREQHLKQTKLSLGDADIFIHLITMSLLYYNCMHSPNL